MFIHRNRKDIYKYFFLVNNTIQLLKLSLNRVKAIETESLNHVLQTNGFGGGWYNEAGETEESTSGADMSTGHSVQREATQAFRPVPDFHRRVGRVRRRHGGLRPRDRDQIDGEHLEATKTEDNQMELCSQALLQVEEQVEEVIPRQSEARRGDQPSVGQAEKSAEDEPVVSEGPVRLRSEKEVLHQRARLLRRAGPLRRSKVDPNPYAIRVSISIHDLRTLRSSSLDSSLDFERNLPIPSVT